MKPVIFYGVLPMLLDGARGSKGAQGALDALQQDILCSDNWEAEAEQLGYQEGRRIPGYHSMWVQGLDHEDEAPGLVTVRASCIGLRTAGERRVRRISCGSREWSIGPHERVVLAWSEDEKGEDNGNQIDRVRRRVPKLQGDNGEIDYKVIGTPSGFGARWDIKEAILVVTDSYYTTVRPATNLGGTVLAPPNAPTPPPYIWGGYGEAMRARHPNGWVLDDRQIEEIFRISDTQGLWQVTDVHAYYYPASPD